MSGPSLQKLDAHRSIHAGAQFEAQELLSIVIKLYQAEQKEKCLEIAKALVESSETRTLGHADAEEEAFYKEKAEDNPALRDTIIQLTRDHDLMRMIVKEIKELLTNNGVTPDVIDRFKALAIVNNIHGQEEEKHLLS